MASRFVPMNWCLKDVNDTVPDGVNRTYFLGFNEPNNVHNCNTSPSDSAKAWGQVMRQWPGTKLVSPATAGDGRPWLDAFFEECKSLYGPTGCNISYVAVHDYSCDPPTTMSYLQEINQRYNLPVWMTEFSCGDGAAKRPTKDHIAFMKQIVPLLDAAPYVFRYAWMSCRDNSNNLRGLVSSDGQLTELGQLYNSL
jgi:hypothetical protein